ncbi:MAG: TerC family protein [Bacteroidota bacterium]
MEQLLTTESLISFLILTLLEVVLGIDNVIFVSLIMNRMPSESDRKKAKRWWMILGIGSRTALLFGLGWLLSQQGKELFNVGGKSIDLSSLVMLVGGLFLMYKSVKEIHTKLEGTDQFQSQGSGQGLSLVMGLFQIMLIDAVFSFDSILTAGGTAKHIEIMIAAVVVAMIMMFRFSGIISDFVHKHPTVKMLALAFLVMIGLSLVMEGWNHKAAAELNLKNYIYFGMAFSFVVEMLNLGMRRKTASKPVELREPTLPEESDQE